MTSSNDPLSAGERGSPEAFGSSPAGGTTRPAESQTIVLQQMGDMPPEISMSDVRRRLQVVTRVVRQRWWAGLLAGVAVALPLGLYVANKPVDRVAQTTVLVQSTLDDVLTQGGRVSQDDIEVASKNYLSVLESRTFLLRVAQTFTEEESLIIQEPYLEPEDERSVYSLAGLLNGLITVQRDRGRPFFTISAAHRDRSFALMMAERVSDEFRKYLQEDVKSARGEATRILREQADVLSTEITRLSDERREYRKEFNLINVEENQSIIAERLRRINAALSDLRVDRVRLETQLEQADRDLGKTDMPFDNPVLSGFANLKVLRADLDRLRSEKGAMATQLGPNHPRMLEMDRNISMLAENIANGYRVAREDLFGQLQLAAASQQQMQAELTAAFNQSLELDKLAGGFKRLSDELVAKEQALASLLKQIEQTDIEAQRPTEGLRTIDPPYVTSASLLRRLIMFAGVGIVGMAAFLGMPLGIYFWSERLSGNMDLEATFNKEVLGVLPRFTKVEEDDRPHIVRDNVELPHVETYLGLVAQFELSSKKQYPRRILVTSTVPGEGKSINASNLAATFTRYGHKTVIVDCDFRRPVQHRFHRIEHDEGLLAWASRGFPLTDDLLAPGGAVGLTKLPDGTSLIPAGGVDVQPGHVLVARPVSELFRRLSQAFDVVIVDSPPAGVFQDALMLARHCGETMVFVREGKAFTSQLKKVLSDLERTPAPAMGLVLNVSSLKNVHPSVGSRYGYGKYGYGSDYSTNYSYKAKPKPNAVNGRTPAPAPGKVAPAPKPAVVGKR